MDYGSVITLWRYAIIHPVYTRDTFHGEFPLLVTRSVNEPSKSFHRAWRRPLLALSQLRKTLYLMGIYTLSRIPKILKVAHWL